MENMKGSDTFSNKQEDSQDSFFNDVFNAIAVSETIPDEYFREALKNSNRQSKTSTNHHDVIPTKTTTDTAVKKTERTSNVAENKSVKNGTENQKKLNILPSKFDPTKLSNSKPDVETKLVHSKPDAVTKPANSKPVEATKPANSKSDKVTKLANAKPDSATKLENAKPVEATKPANSKPDATTNPANSKSDAATKPANSKPDAATPEQTKQVSNGKKESPVLVNKSLNPTNQKSPVKEVKEKKKGSRLSRHSFKNVYNKFSSGKGKSDKSQEDKSDPKSAEESKTAQKESTSQASKK